MPPESADSVPHCASLVLLLHVDSPRTCVSRLLALLCVLAGLFRVVEGLLCFPESFVLHARYPYVLHL